MLGIYQESLGKVSNLQGSRTIQQPRNTAGINGRLVSSYPLNGAGGPGSADHPLVADANDHAAECFRRRSRLVWNQDLAIPLD